MSALRKGLRIIGLVLIVAAILAAYFGFVVMMGVRSGESERAERQIATVNADVVINYTLAQDSLEAENYVLAERAIERVMTEIPYATAGDVSREDVDILYAEIVGRQASIPMPTATVELLPPPEATATRRPTRTPRPGTDDRTPEPATKTPQPTLEPTTEPTKTVDEEELNEEIAAAETLLENSKYESAVEALIAFQLVNPNYERYRTDSLLFDAYIGVGFQLTSGNEVSRGVNYLELAQRLGTLPASADAQLQSSKLYLQGLAYRGIRWPVSIANFSSLCGYAPGFHDPCGLLYDAYVAYGRQLAESGSPCLAIEQYQLAYAQSATAALNQPLAQAEADCTADKAKAGITTTIKATVAITDTGGTLTIMPLPTQTLRPGQGPWTPTPEPNE